MADRYASKGSQTITTTPGATALSLAGVTTTRAKCYDFTVGSNDTPADVALEYTVIRFSASGTGTAVVPEALDSDAPASLLTVEQNHTIEPTYVTAEILWHIAANQRATYRWVAAPDGELMVPASADAGFGWAAFHASAVPDFVVSAHHYE